SFILIVCANTPPPPSPTLFPYTTLFRSPPGGGAAGDRRGRSRHRGHPHRIGEDDDRVLRDLRRHGPRPALVLHRPHQGPGEREVLRPRRTVRGRERGDDDR